MPRGVTYRRWLWSALLAVGVAGVSVCVADTSAPPGMVRLRIDFPHALFDMGPGRLTTPNLEPPHRFLAPTLFVPKGTTNLALRAKITGSVLEPELGRYDQLKDGDKEAESYVTIGRGKQWVQLDLGQPHELYAIVFWHDFSPPRIYHAVVVQVANDPDFLTGVRTLFNADYKSELGLGVGKDFDYIEGFEGKLVDPKGVKARCVRLYSNGNTKLGCTTGCVEDRNTYTEIEVYGKP